MEEKKLHPWRICPLGKHFVKEHTRKVKASTKNPNGRTSVRSHCAENPTKADQLYFDEIQEMTDRYFNDFKIPPQNKLKAKNSNDFDHLIIGWLTYWNEVLETETPIDFYTVKALIASESTFNLKLKPTRVTKNNFARGLMQVTDETLKILRDEKGEIKKHYINLTKKTILDPSSNICAGIRWLFHKRKLSYVTTKKILTWSEVVEFYKAYYGKKDKSGMDHYYKFLNELTPRKDNKK